MSKVDPRPGTKPWEFLVYVLVTIPLLVVGVVLWFFSLLLRMARLGGKRKLNG